MPATPTSKDPVSVPFLKHSQWPNLLQEKDFSFDPGTTQRGILWVCPKDCVIDAAALRYEQNEGFGGSDAQSTSLHPGFRLCKVADGVTDLSNNEPLTESADMNDTAGYMIDLEMLGISNGGVGSTEQAIVILAGETIIWEFEEAAPPGVLGQITGVVAVRQIGTNLEL